jgi:hypothetical protein
MSYGLKRAASDSEGFVGYDGTEDMPRQQRMRFHFSGVEISISTCIVEGAGVHPV